jgi:integrase
LLAFGKYTDVSLVAAGVMRHKAKRQTKAGVNAAPAKHIEKTQKATAAAPTFAAVARKSHTIKLETWQERTATNTMHRLEKDVFPLIGHPIADIKAPVILDVLRQIEKRGALDMAKRHGQVCGQIFHDAIASGRAESDSVPSGKFPVRDTGASSNRLQTHLRLFSSACGTHDGVLHPVAGNGTTRHESHRLV